jgi:D-alanyl-lipoteichoic acid acyltransferase DltB (MBOAT superfamily)
VFLLFFVLSRYNEKFRKVFEQDINIMVTMLLGGLWHGSSWLFVIWGGLNGLAVVIHKQWEKISPFKNSQNIFVKFSLMITTLLFISYTRIFFRSQTLENAIKMNEKIFSKWNFEYILPITTHYADVLILLLLCYIVHWLPEKLKEIIYNSVSKLPIALLVILSCVIVFLLYQLMASNSRPFIYFQF